MLFRNRVSAFLQRAAQQYGRLRAITGYREPSTHRSSMITAAIVFLVFTSFGCYRDRTLSERPPQLLSQQEMVSFLIDLHLAEAKMNYIEVGKTDSLEMIFRNYEKYLMHQHGFTDSVYLQSYQYYLDHMKLMDDIYSDVVDSLNVMSSRQKAKQSDEASDEP